MYVDAKKLYDFSVKCFNQAGMSSEDAKTVTDTMIVADSRGIHSHGFLRLPIYIERIKKGFITTDTEMEVVKDQNSISVLDGKFAAGQVVGKKAMETSIEKARETGMGLSVVRNSNHFGIAAYYASMAAEQNMIGIAISNVEPLMPAIGGAEKIIGNNPIAIAAPSKEGENPIVLDMALSNVPLGKILVASTKGESIPEGWGVDRKGEPTTDPNDVKDGGFLYPVGGPKGFGLALLTEILTGVISDGQYSKNIPSMYNLEEKQSISHFMLAIDVSVFLGPENYAEKIENVISFVKDSKKAPGVEETFLPGEIEFKREEANKDQGVPMSEEVFAQLLKLSGEVNIPLNV
ncbi:Ldh family oxidoreductase [Halobacillus amylolyticus]|uniref:Ldh family oxidoreductase n=1 Tax=Halobacillus amylolyticus TaxID=2932259 RepID=A0ABY4H915_9BACI|nr:Ldh family oxidoreductase [Halobacillus amylolyticus]UOR11366.1 Ldh family oxidoreductase [Halobacillus amylolyticus]